MKRTFIAVAGAALLALGLVGGTLAAPKDKVTVCHTGNGTNYTSIEAALTADAGGHDGHTDDIIPPFDYTGGHYDGKNWDAVGQDIYNNGACDGDGIIDGGGVTDQPTDQPPTDTAFGSTGSSGPADTAWLLVVGLGVLLASIVVLTPARAKSRR